MLGLFFRFALFASRIAPRYAQIHHRASRTALLTGFKTTILTRLCVCFMRERHQTNRRAHDQRCKMKFLHPILPLRHTRSDRAAQLFNLSPLVERAITGKSPWLLWRCIALRLSPQPGIARLASAPEILEATVGRQTSQKMTRCSDCCLLNGDRVAVIWSMSALDCLAGSLAAKRVDLSCKNRRIFIE